MRSPRAPTGDVYLHRWGNAIWQQLELRVRTAANAITLAAKEPGADQALQASHQGDRAEPGAVEKKI